MIVKKRMVMSWHFIIRFLCPRLTLLRWTAGSTSWRVFQTVCCGHTVLYCFVSCAPGRPCYHGQLDQHSEGCSRQCAVAILYCIVLYCILCPRLTLLPWTAGSTFWRVFQTVCCGHTVLYCTVLYPVPQVDPATMDSWINILKGVPDSVLWPYCIVLYCIVSCAPGWPCYHGQLDQHPEGCSRQRAVAAALPSGRRGKHPALRPEAGNRRQQNRLLSRRPQGGCGVVS